MSLFVEDSLKEPEIVKYHMKNRNEKTTDFVSNYLLMLVSEQLQ